jgi:hypothetical protein
MNPNCYVSFKSHSIRSFLSKWEQNLLILAFAVFPREYPSLQYFLRNVEQY